MGAGENIVSILTHTHHFQISKEKGQSFLSRCCLTSITMPIIKIRLSCLYHENTIPEKTVFILKQGPGYGTAKLFLGPLYWCHRHYRGRAQRRKCVTLEQSMAEQGLSQWDTDTSHTWIKLPLICVVKVDGSAWFQNQKRSYETASDRWYVLARTIDLRHWACVFKLVSHRFAFMWSPLLTWINFHPSMNNYSHYKVWGEITNPLPNLSLGMNMKFYPHP